MSGSTTAYCINDFLGMEDLDMIWYILDRNLRRIYRFV